jgi:hypothetical protein
VTRSSHTPGPAHGRPRRAWRFLALGAVAAILLAACSSGDSGDATRIGDLAEVDPLLSDDDPGEPVALTDPEAYGLPPLTTLQTNPGGVAEGLLARQSQTTWSMVWQVRDVTGDAVADIIVEHLPAEASDTGSAKFHVHASAGTPDTGIIQVAILDEGQGARWCAQQGTSTWVCDVDEVETDFVFEFLSLDGFAELSRLIREAIALPGLSVQYALVAGTPAACFYFSPVPEGVTAQAESVDLDLSQGGHFCLSTEGAPIRLATPEITITAVEYSKSVDADRFALPV